MRKPLLRIVICLVWVPLAHGQIPVEGDRILEFASVDKGKEILTQRDDFVRRMSPFDRAARMKTERRVSEEEYLEFVGRNILPWKEDEKRKIGSAFQGIQSELQALSLPLPEKVFVIKTTGKEEGGAPYTRANAIVFPEAELTVPAGKIREIVCHELFHIFTRRNPGLREKLYPIIGFVKCGEIDFPEELNSRRITNPDAPRNDHCIWLQVEGRGEWAVPILFSDAENYDMIRGGEFFDSLQFRFLLPGWGDDLSAIKPPEDRRKPRLIGIEEAHGFFEQVGRNTNYIIHPEEILADNFVFLLMGTPNLPSPEIVENLRDKLR